MTLSDLWQQHAAAPHPPRPRRKCGVHAVSMREWESSCGGWEDYQYKCHHCGHTW